MADEDPQDQDGTDSGDNLKDLRRAAADGRKAREDADRAQRELAFVKAGIDTDSTAGKMFMQFYEGELATEAIKTGWSELGIGQKTEQQASTQSSEPTPEQIAQTQARGALASESGLPGDGSADPWAAGYEAYDRARKEGAANELAAGALFAEIFGAANRGDPRVVYRDPPRAS